MDCLPPSVKIGKLTLAVLVNGTELDAVHFSVAGVPLGSQLGMRDEVGYRLGQREVNMVPRVVQFNNGMQWVSIDAKITQLLSAFLEDLMRYIMTFWKVS